MLDCETRWNSTYLMRQRFCQLEKTITAFFPDRQFEWNKLKFLTNVLQPFYEITLEVQKKEVQNTFNFYEKSVNYIENYVTNEGGLDFVRASDVLKLLDKWCGSRKAIIQAFNQSGKLYRKLASDFDKENSESASIEHTYSRRKSFKDYLNYEKNIGPKEEKCVNLRSIPSSNADTERCKVIKN